ncbi:MAG: chorismate-binding protein [Prolixibacteraceae bacterium]|jgi:isochorismate synthase|nr:chorismate-binding protein [Prolixibacteraceae bacterium]
MTNNEYATLIDQLLDKNIAFAGWFFPGETDAGLLAGNPEDVVFFDRFNQLNGEKGFVFAPFRITETSPVILLKPGFYTESIRSVKTFEITHFKSVNKKEKEGQYRFLTKEEYLCSIEDTISEIKNGTLSKVIISRRIPVSRNGDSPGEIFLKLKSQAPNAFCYIVNLPIAGTWMGATPEILLRSEEDSYETVSLAGTQPRRTDTDYSWHTKDIEEQAFVSRYMLDVFHRFGIDRYKTKGPDTMESGKVAHLSTSFYFQAEKISHCLGDFIAELHPTPAVCGLPKDVADEFIRLHEKHHRKYYTGYLGHWRLNNEVRLFVNLRCMEILSEQFVLYVGGGITAKSVPEQEWEETIQKARTLLSALQTDTE